MTKPPRKMPMPWKRASSATGDHTVRPELVQQAYEVGVRKGVPQPVVVITTADNPRLGENTKASGVVYLTMSQEQAETNYGPKPAGVVIEDGQVLVIADWPDTITYGAFAIGPQSN